MDKQANRLKQERSKLREIMAAELRGWPDFKVTRRESQILTVLADSPLLTNKEIANKFCIAERTVKYHFSSLLRKFDAENRADLLLISGNKKEIIQ